MAETGTSLYVLEVLCRGEAIGVKIGITASFHTRLAAHQALAGNYGCEIGRVWCGDSHPAARSLEMALKKLSPSGKKEFIPSTFEDMVERVQELARQPVSPPATPLTSLSTQRSVTWAGTAMGEWFAAEVDRIRATTGKMEIF